MKFTASSTAAQVLQGISLVGKTAIVTGSSSGLGIESALQLSAAGAKVLLLARNTDKLRLVQNEIQSRTGNSVDIFHADFTDLYSVSECAQEIIDLKTSIDILINNAGVLAMKDRQVSIDGNELHMATNFLGPFLLTKLLIPLMLKTKSPRVVNVSSIIHMKGKIDFNDFHSTSKYLDWTAYGTEILIKHDLKQQTYYMRFN